MEKDLSQEIEKEPKNMEKEFKIAIDFLAKQLEKFTDIIGWPRRNDEEIGKRALWKNTLTRETIINFKKAALEILKREFEKVKKGETTYRVFEFKVEYFRGHGTVYGHEILEKSGIDQMDVPSGLMVKIMPGHVMLDAGMAEEDLEKRKNWPIWIEVDSE